MHKAVKETLVLHLDKTQHSFLSEIVCQNVTYSFVIDTALVTWPPEADASADAGGSTGAVKSSPRLHGLVAVLAHVDLGDDDSYSTVYIFQDGGFCSVDTDGLTPVSFAHMMTLNPYATAYWCLPDVSDSTLRQSQTCVSAARIKCRFLVSKLETEHICFITWKNLGNEIDACFDLDDQLALMKLQVRLNYKKFWKGCLEPWDLPLLK